MPPKPDASTSSPANGAAPLSTTLPAPAAPTPLAALTPPLAPATLALHADAHLPGPTDVAPPIHVSTNFAYPVDPALLDPSQPPEYAYSREATPTTARLETLLAPLLRTRPDRTLVYGSGLAALHALYVALAPARVACGPGYHGTQAVLRLHQRLLPHLQVLPLPASVDDPQRHEDEARAAIAKLGLGDVVHLETPTNPTGEARDIRAHAAWARAQGAWLVVDGTFAPPGLQDALGCGADVVMMSGTKYLGGHGDLLCGVLALRDDDGADVDTLATLLRADRAVLGGVIGGLEAWLCARSLRTLALRVERQSRSAGALVAWLEAERAQHAGADDGASGSGQPPPTPTTSVIGRAVRRVRHASVQATALSDERGAWLRAQMPNGWGPVFALELASEALARRLPSRLRLFVHATSLGGVESLIEWRRMSDASADPALVRVSVGCEAVEDLKADLARGLAEALAAEEENASEGVRAA